MSDSKNKKLKLKELNVSSFSTSIVKKEKETIQGETAPAGCSVVVLSLASITWSVVLSGATLVLGCLGDNEEEPKPVAPTVLCPHLSELKTPDRISFLTESDYQWLTYCGPNCR